MYEILGMCLVIFLLLIFCFYYFYKNKQIKKIAQLYEYELGVFQALADLSPVGIFKIDPDGIYTFVNKRWMELYGISSEEAMKGEWSSVIHPEDFDRIVLQRHELLSADTFEEEYRIINASTKRLYWVFEQSQKISEQNNEVVGTIIDITDRKEKEIALQESNRVLKEFIFLASHDLQEPLRKIYAFGEILENKLLHNEDTEIIKYLKYMTSGAKRMKQLIEDLLYLSQMDAAIFVLSECDLNNIVAECIKELQDDLHLASAKVIIDELPIVMAHQTMLVQVFLNLLSNSIKYRHQDKKLVIHIYCEKVKETMYKIYIQDNGIGFDMRYANQIFEAFKRLHGVNKYPGTGVGLTVCSRIIKKHQGEIGVTSEIDKGSLFWFTLLSGEKNDN